MTMCSQLSERMPAVAAEKAHWSAEEEAHLAACSDCRAEWALVEAVRRVPRGSGVDPARVASAVRARLAAAPVEVKVIPFRRRLGWVAGVAAAAAIVFALVRSTPAGPDVMLGELAGLDSTELAEVFDDWAPAAETAPPVAAFVSGMADLTTEELEEILRGMES